MMTVVIVVVLPFANVGLDLEGVGFGPTWVSITVIVVVLPLPMAGEELDSLTGDHDAMEVSDELSALTGGHVTIEGDEEAGSLTGSQGTM